MLFINYVFRSQFRFMNCYKHLIRSMKCETSCENWSKPIKFSMARQMKFIKCERITFKVHCGNFVSIKLLVGLETNAEL
jgi:hypothetical protein